MDDSRVSSVKRDKGCRHCQRPATGDFCCTGCEHVYHYIQSSGLSRYYSIRDEVKTPSLPHEESFKTEGQAEYPQFSCEPFIWQQSRSRTVFAAYLPTLSCAACLWLIRATLSRIPHVTAVDVNFDDKLVFVKIDPPGFMEQDSRHEIQERQLSSILTALMKVGYKAFPPSVGLQSGERHETWRKTMIDLAISGAVFGNVMLFAAAVYLGREPGDLYHLNSARSAWIIEDGFRRFFDLTSMVLTTLSLTLVGRRFFINAWNSLRQRSIHVDQPIAIALALAYAVSVRNLWDGSPLLYFDSVSGLVFLLLAGRATSDMLTQRAKRLAQSAVSAIPPSKVKEGEVYKVSPGDIMLTDGVIVSGFGEVSEVALTGETTPVMKVQGSKVLAGSQNLTSALSVRATSSAGDSYVQRIKKIISTATLEKPSLSSSLDAVLRWFVLGIFVVTGLAVYLWWESGAGKLIEVICAVLIVSCPCALALAVPLARSFSLQRAWRRGVIIKTPEALERAAQVDTILLDKTGTLTTGVLSITKVWEGRLEDFEPLELHAVAVLAKRSKHPMSRALAKFLDETANQRPQAHDDALLSDIVEHPGFGISATCAWGSGFKTIRIGRSSFIKESPDSIDSPGFSVETVTESGARQRRILSFQTEDPLRLDSLETIERWRQRGLDVLILSGDRPDNVKDVASQLGISTWLAEATPEQKQNYVSNRVSAGHIVAMIGDGINDACAMGVAHVGIAVQGGADLALASADIFLSREGLAAVNETFEYARYFLTTQKIVLMFGVVYNIVAVSLALGGILHPLVAALIMPLSSITVIAIAYFRKGASIWKSYMSSCRLLSPSAA